MKNVLGACGLSVLLGTLAGMIALPTGDVFAFMTVAVSAALALGLSLVAWPVVFVIAKRFIDRDGLSASTAGARLSSVVVILAAVAAVAVGLDLWSISRWGAGDPGINTLVLTALGSAAGYFPIRYLAIRKRGVLQG